MSLCRYSLDTSPLAWVDLPAIPRFGSDYQTEVNDDVCYETDGGVVWTFRRFKRAQWQLTFRVSQTELLAFRALHDLVQGITTAFWFQFSTYVIFCRKEPGFNPQMLTTPIAPPWYDYTLILKEEIPAAEILA